MKLKKSSANYCVNLVRKHDYENFLCTLLWPDTKVRRAMFAIRAFNTEIALVRDQVSQKELGLGRMFFWRDALNQLYSNKLSNKPYVPKHPVVIEMSNVILGNDLSKKWLSNLLDSRERMMTDTPFKDLLELEGYCDQSITSVLYLALELLEVKNVDVDHAASHLGKAIGLSNFIRSIPFNAQRRRVLVPQELLIKNQVSQENFVRNTEREKLQEVVYEIACYAHSHYEKAKSMNTHGLSLIASSKTADCGDMAEGALSERSCRGKAEFLLGEDILSSTKIDLPGLDTPGSLELLLKDIEDNRHNDKRAEAALSNFVILRNVLSTLSNEDLESCCNVSQYWRTVADPMITIHYDITLGKEGMGGLDRDKADNARLTDHVVIKERVRYNQRDFKVYETNLEGHANVTGFMTKFGSFVRSLSFADEATMTTAQFCKLLIHNFPNLEKLNCSMLQLTDDRQNFNPGLPENKLYHLKRIYFSAGVRFDYRCFVTILKTAPNLEEIRDFPLHLIESLMITQKASTLKSLAYPNNEPWLLKESGETVETIFRKLAQVQPKLEFFRFVPPSFWNWAREDGYLHTLKSHIYSVLQSSDESLETFTIVPLEAYGFQNIPPLKSVKIIEFHLTGLIDEPYVYFPANISLGEIFPHVTEFGIFMILSEVLMNQYFPPNIFSPWGSQIQKLKIRSVTQGCIPLLQRLFPLIKEFIVIASPIKLQAILPDMVQLWPDLESLVIGLDYSWYVWNSSPLPTLDSVLTGISEDLIIQLKDQSTKEKFTADQIQEFRSGSTIAKFKKLKTLKLIVRCRFLTSDFDDKLIALSKVSSDFAFELLPGLKVTLGIWKDHQFAKEMKTAFEPLASNIVDFVPSYLDYDLLFV
ncbi:unnamed protein product [Allacma fusca]|uniref:Uncharacterized protein n=1 Tax=Allacma fusca TaxID=39272 RepID=A0A8J2NZU6_9HEXA|nr:unnamed protein product [Allacma fusca]